MTAPADRSLSGQHTSVPDAALADRLEIIQRVARVGFWEMRVADRHLVVSHELRMLFGVRPGAPAPDFATLLACVHPADRQHVEDAIGHALLHGTALDLEHRVRDADGAIRHLHARGELVHGKDGTPTYYGTVQDVTAQRRAEQESAALAARLCGTLESITDVFYTVDHDWRFTYLNGEAERLFQRPRGELLGKVLWDEFEALRTMPGHAELQRAMRERCTVSFAAFFPAYGLHCAVRAYPSEGAEETGLAVYIHDMTAQKRTEDALRQSEERLRMVAQATSDVVWELDPESGGIWFSGNLLKLFGYTPGGPAYSVALWRDHIHPDDRRRVLEGFERAIYASRDGAWTEHYRFIREDGSEARVHDRAQILRDAHGRAVRVVGAMVDVSEQHAADARIREQASLLDKAKDAIVVIGLDRRIRYWNEGARRLYGWRADEALGRSTLELVDTDATGFARAVAAVLEHGEWSGEAVARRKDGARLTVEAQWTLVRDEHGRPHAIFAIDTDISKRKEAERRVQYLAFHDALTHLPNRLLLSEHLAAALAAARRDGHFRALLLIDLDNFKTLNDTLGHTLGDLLLQQVAIRLYAGLSPDTTVARFGGDEFAVLLGELGTRRRDALARARQVGEHIIDLLGQPYQLDGFHMQRGASIGITVFSGADGGPDEQLKRADMAMYRAKAAGRDTVCFFDPAMQDVMMARLALENDLRDSLRNHAFFLHYQPQVERDGRIGGVEALIRWDHPRRGRVSPAEFIPLAEEIGLALPLGQWVLECACRQLSAWAARPETAHLEIAVNVSARQLHHPSFVAQVLACLEPTGADPRKLKLEITEGTLLDDLEDAIGKIQALRAHGLSFAIDDFGTGYSSLAYLKRLPLDMLKIDRSFVLDLTTNPSDAVIARTIIALGASLGLKVLAEGVETEAQRDFLFEHGCQAYQGYLCARPLAAEELVPMLGGASGDRAGAGAGPRGASGPPPRP